LRNADYPYPYIVWEPRFWRGFPVALDGGVPAHNYYATFTTAQLKALNSAADAKTYYLVVENASGGYSPFESFTVAAGNVTGWYERVAGDVY
jgi:hypothetical protein